MSIKLPPLPEPHDGPNYHTDGIALFTDDQMQAYVIEALAQPAERQGEAVAWADEIIDDLHALYNSEMITENDSGDELIRLDAAVAAVDEAKARHIAAHPAPAQQQPLSEEQLEQLRLETGYAAGLPRFTLICRAIEAAHGIGGEK